LKEQVGRVRPQKPRGGVRYSELRGIGKSPDLEEKRGGNPTKSEKKKKTTDFECVLRVGRPVKRRGEEPIKK